MANGLDAVRYTASTARVKGLYARLLDGTTWRDLIIAEGFHRTISLLKETTYGDVVSNLEQSGQLTLEMLERHLSGKAAANLRRTMTFTSGGVRHLLVVWWQHFELENLKGVFRGVHQELEPDTIRNLLIPLGGYSTLNWEGLLHERSVRSLVGRLEGTHYINPLRNALSAYERERTLFPLEIALDIRYYRDLAAAILDLNGQDREDARRVLGIHLDILNILWAYRYRVYHALSAEEIVNYTLWRTFRTNADLIRRIALGAPPADILVEVWGQNAFHPSELAALDSSPQMIPRLELTLQRLWRRVAQREMGGYPFKLGTLLGYVILQELETQDLITLLEGKVMGWSVERVQEYLFRYEE
jgi:V/A-type H+-transporting ATPase subunit C